MGPGRRYLGGLRPHELHGSSSTATASPMPPAGPKPARLRATTTTTTSRRTQPQHPPKRCTERPKRTQKRCTERPKTRKNCAYTLMSYTTRAVGKVIPSDKTQPFNKIEIIKIYQYSILFKEIAFVAYQPRVFYDKLLELF